MRRERDETKKAASNFPTNEQKKDSRDMIVGFLRHRKKSLKNKMVCAIRKTVSGSRVKNAVKRDDFLGIRCMTCTLAALFLCSFRAFVGEFFSFLFFILL
jgi:hypothetical protein